MGKEVLANMDINYLSPYIRVAMDSRIEPPWHLQERVIFDYELLYVKEGRILVTVEDREYFGNPGDIFLFKPKQRHSIRVLGENCFRQPHIHFDLFYQQDSPEVKVSFKPLESMTDHEMRWFREDVTKNPAMQLPNKICLRNTRYFEDMLFDIINEFTMKMPFYEINIKGLFTKLWTYLMRENYMENNPAVLGNIDELIRIKDYLASNIDREITLDMLTKEFKISKFHLVRLFKKAFGITPMHYNRLVRINKAKEMIQFTSKSFTEISEMLGFNSVNAFSRNFRNVEGVPPSFYRRKG